jgi:hypothetical protein
MRLRKKAQSVVRGLKPNRFGDKSRRSVQPFKLTTNINLTTRNKNRYKVKTKTTVLNRFAKMKTAALTALAVAALASTPALAGDNDSDGDDFKFDLVPSTGLPAAALSGALKNAHGRVRVESVGPVEIMDVTVWGLPPNTDFRFLRDPGTK